MRVLSLPLWSQTIERGKTVETDLNSVKELMAWVKMPGKVLEKAETHFMGGGKTWWTG